MKAIIILLLFLSSGGWGIINVLREHVHHHYHHRHHHHHLIIIITMIIIIIVIIIVVIIIIYPLSAAASPSSPPPSYRERHACRTYACTRRHAFVSQERSINVLDLDMICISWVGALTSLLPACPMNRFFTSHHQEKSAETLPCLALPYRYWQQLSFLRLHRSGYGGKLSRATYTNTGVHEQLSFCAFSAPERI